MIKHKIKYPIKIRYSVEPQRNVFGTRVRSWSNTMNQEEYVSPDDIRMPEPPLEELT